MTKSQNVQKVYFYLILELWQKVKTYKKLTFLILEFDEKKPKRQTVPEVKILFGLTYTLRFETLNLEKKTTQKKLKYEWNQKVV